MKRFIQRFGDKITGVLSGFDRILIHGTLRRIAYLTGMKDFLWHNNVLWKDFGPYAQKVTRQLKESCIGIAHHNGRSVIYVNSSSENKEAIAVKIANEERIRQGLIAVISCVEPCNSYDIYRNRETKQIDLVVRKRKCLHYYYYLIHSEFGFMNVRIQTWFPFNIQICLNGREWLSRQMDARGIQYRRLDNCFSWIEDLQTAQRLMRRHLQINWPKKLREMAEFINPIQKEIFQKYPLDYYWSIPQSEWATDLMFKDRASLASIYPSLIRQGITNFGSTDVMRFLAKRLTCFQGEVISDLKVRSEGVRIKHKIGTNSIKLYDKFGLVLRTEVTINDPRALRVFRPKENDPKGECKLRYLRKGVADIQRRAEVCQRANERYLDAMATADLRTPFAQLLRQISAPTTWKGKRVRALRPWGQQDQALIKAVSRGEFNITGFRNRDLQGLLYNHPPASEKQKRSRSSRISRLLRMLRAHHIIRRIPRSYKYMLTDRGRDLFNAILSTDNLTIEQLKNAAA